MNSINNTNLSCGYNIWETTEFTLPGAWLNNKGTSGNLIIKTIKKNNDKNYETVDGIVEYSQDTNNIPRLFILKDHTNFYSYSSDLKKDTCDYYNDIIFDIPEAVVIFSNRTNTLPLGEYAIYSSSKTINVEGQDESNAEDDTMLNGFNYKSTGIINKNGELSAFDNTYVESTNNLYLLSRPVEVQYYKVSRSSKGSGWLYSNINTNNSTWKTGDNDYDYIYSLSIYKDYDSKIYYVLLKNFYDYFNAGDSNWTGVNFSTTSSGIAELDKNNTTSAES